MKRQQLQITTKCNFAFTMAEILLSLTIIGVVAAITLPSLTGNINERTWATQRKALHARMSQAVALMNSLRGYGSISQSSSGGYVNYFSDNATEVFISSGLSKVLKLNNICNNISDCGMPNEVTNLVGSRVNLAELSVLQQYYEGFCGATCGMSYGVHTSSAAFETQNGESVLVYYNPLCKSLDSLYTVSGNSSSSISNIMCLNFVYDLNGKRGPNIVNKDVGFMTVFYPDSPVVVAPIPAVKDASSGVTWSNASRVCSSQGDDYRLPNKEEMASIGVNYKLVTGGDGMPSTYATSERTGEISAYSGLPYAWYYLHSYFGSLGFRYDDINGTAAVRCIKRF